MNIESIYNKIACISPHIEVLLRQIYWNNVDILSKFRLKSKKKDDKKAALIPTDFNQIIEVLKSFGVKKGSLIIVHSSYDSLESTGLSPDEIIDALLELIGKEGTLAMPVIRLYKQCYKKGKEYITFNTDNIICKYNVQKTMVVTGLLPYSLMRRKDSETSRHPLNPLTAVGPLAKSMMEHELEGDKPSPHGPDSSWKYCLDHNALVIGLGIDLSHYCTIGHVVEETTPNWPIKDWYRNRNFEIIDHEFRKNIVVKERKPKWGTLYLAEQNLKKRLIKDNILHSQKLNTIDISYVDAQIHNKYLRSIITSSFPYVIPKKYLKNNIDV
jgi:aminoglycoside 3-N-acetyltransferase